VVLRAAQGRMPRAGHGGSGAGSGGSVVSGGGSGGKVALSRIHLSSHRSSTNRLRTGLVT